MVQRRALSLHLEAHGARKGFDSPCLFCKHTGRPLQEFRVSQGVIRVELKYTSREYAQRDSDRDRGRYDNRDSYS
jgi:hypothetical protein